MVQRKGAAVAVEVPELEVEEEDAAERVGLLPTGFGLREAARELGVRHVRLEPGDAQVGLRDRLRPARQREYPADSARDAGDRAGDDAHRARPRTAASAASLDRIDDLVAAVGPGLVGAAARRRSNLHRRRSA